MEKQIGELLDMGIIVRQSDGQSDRLRGQEKWRVRLAVDYRYLNSFTVADAYPMVTVNEIPNKMESANYISLFDAKSGYWQIPVAEEDQWKIGRAHV